MEGGGGLLQMVAWPRKGLGKMFVGEVNELRSVFTSKHKPMPADAATLMSGDLRGLLAAVVRETMPLIRSANISRAVMG